MGEIGLWMEEIGLFKSDSEIKDFTKPYTNTRKF